MRSPVLSLLGFLALAACGGGGGGGDDGPSVDAAPPLPDAPVVPAFRNPVDLPDAELAPQALALIEATCEDSGCHDITRQRLRYWRGLADQAFTSCLTDLTASSPEKAKEMLDCTRLASKRFAPKSLGVIASGGNLAWFEFQFQRAYGDAAAEELAAFRDEASMPRGDRPPFNQAQFDIVMEWFLRGEGLPMVDDLLPADPAPTTCEGSVSAEVGRHVAAMATTGWAAVNRDEGVLMHGCAGADDPKDCLASYPAAATTAFGADWQTIDGAVLRVLRDNDYASAYWTRSSADGRFVGHGRDAGRGQPGAAVIDLAAAGGKVIPVQALYDPGFFPDNSGFMFQPSSNGGARVCLQSVLTAATGTVTLREPSCGLAESIGLYQHVGRALGGGDYWTVDGQFQSDDQGKQVGRTENVDPGVQAGREADVRLTALLNNGTSFVERATRDGIPVPFEADVVMAPSAKLVVTRFGGANDKQLGFVLRRVDVTGPASDFTAEMPEIARYCYPGGKPAFSLDERWLVVHHYLTDADAADLGFTGPTDPAFADHRRDGGANVYLIDLVTGVRTRITRMGPGQFALFPHFRSDGWIYFVVRDPGAAGGHREYVVASDAALVLGGD